MAFNEFFTHMVLPFLLVFVLVFAILQKSKILGDGKKQADSLTALVIGLLVIGLPASRNFIVDFIPWVAVGLAALLVFFILYGFSQGDLSSMPSGLKITFGILAGLFTIGVLIYVTGLWEKIANNVNFASEGLFSTVVLVLLVIGALIWVVISTKSGS
jgi:hypothetical protein